MSEFNPAVEVVLVKEGGLVDNPNDPGGITNHGISYRLYKSIYTYATPQDIEDLTVDQAKTVYKQVFWNNANFGLINSQMVCNMVFDMAVNADIRPSIRLLQRSLNCINPSNLLIEDGQLGAETIDYVNRTHPMSIQCCYRACRIGYYYTLVAGKETLRPFLGGWITRALSL